MTVWVKVTVMDATTEVETEVTLKPDSRGQVTMDRELIERFLIEAGYSLVTP